MEFVAPLRQGMQNPFRGASQRPGFARPPRLTRQGAWRAERHGPCLAHVRRRTCERLSARHERRLCGAGPRFPVGHCAQVGRRPVAQYPNVSQLLAGTRSGPGRSPGAARVHRLRTMRAGAATSSRFTERLAKRPLRRTRLGEDKGGLEGGEVSPSAPTRSARPFVSYHAGRDGERAISLASIIAAS